MDLHDRRKLIADELDETALSTALHTEDSRRKGERDIDYFKRFIAAYLDTCETFRLLTELEREYKGVVSRERFLFDIETKPKVLKILHRETTP